MGVLVQSSREQEIQGEPFQLVMCELKVHHLIWSKLVPTLVDKQRSRNGV